jgi:hypothetical protein
MDMNDQTFQKIGQDIVDLYRLLFPHGDIPKPIAPDKIQAQLPASSIAANACIFPIC